MFGRCAEAKENFLSLYNAIHGTNLKIENTSIEPLFLEQTVYTGRYNDVSMLVNGRMVILVEQQSTVNENMPLRFLEYICRLYEKIIPLEKRYRQSRLVLPSPEFYVIYNGTADYPKEKILKLSDSFEHLDDNNDDSQISFPLELCVKTYNINKCKDTPLLKHCIPLSGYAKLTEYAQEAKQNGIQNPIDFAVRKCISEGVLAQYLTQKSTEVRNMLIAEYDYDTDIRVKQEEAWEKGEMQGMKKNKLANAKNLIKLKLLSLEQIAEAIQLPLEDVKKLSAATE
ncbi:MAG: hypothetical protein ACFNKL_04565 [Treponema sp.]